MRSFNLLAGAAALFLAGSSHGLNILLNNDDGFGSGNLRELYRLLKGEGHNGIVPTPSIEVYVRLMNAQSGSWPLPPLKADKEAVLTSRPRAT